MAKNLLLGLSKLLTSDFLLSLQLSGRVNILSIGCGHNLDVLIDEINCLTSFLPESIAINYTGVDLNIPNAADINTTLSQAVKKDICQFRVLQADVNQLQYDDFSQQSGFDLILLRHPQFFDGYEESTKELLRVKIPALLKTNGLLLVSLYSKEEKIYMGENEKTLDALFLKTIYSDFRYHENSVATSSRQHIHNGIFAFDDQCMYSLRNKINTQMSLQAYFKLDTQLSDATKTYILNLVLKIGGKLINRDEGIFSLWKEFIETLQIEICFSCSDVLPAPAPASTSTSASTSTAVSSSSFFAYAPDEHMILMEAINNLKDTPFQIAYHIIYKTLSQRKYNQALRQAASQDNSFTANVIQLLLASGKELNVSPDELNSQQLSAIDYAQKCQHSKLDELISYASKKAEGYNPA